MTQMPPRIERRLHTRHRARTRVHVRPIGKDTPAKMCVATNLSANGVAIVTEDMSLAVGTQCELSFAINLGVLVKIHKRLSRVVHVHNGVTGFIMESLTTT
jgi:hypothetical protein